MMEWASLGAAASSVEVCASQGWIRMCLSMVSFMFQHQDVKHHPGCVCEGVSVGD